MRIRFASKSVKPVRLVGRLSVTALKTIPALTTIRHHLPHRTICDSQWIPPLNPAGSHSTHRTICDSQWIHHSTQRAVGVE